MLTSINGDNRSFCKKKIELYKKLVDATPETDLKGKTMLYTSCNGHMHSFVAKEGYVAIRFSEEEKEAFIKNFDSKPAISHGAVMRGYAVIPEDLLAKIEELVPYLEMSLNYIKTLKPKPTIKKK
ncbi:MAG: hypothetical protein AB8B73_03070 [Ekhidna sp.]